MPPTPSGTDHYCFIIHDNVPYCYDINSILALPTGFRYRNRYRGIWLEGNLHSHSSAMVDAEVLIILRVQRDNYLVPLRWGTIKDAHQVGDIYHFEYVLGDLVGYQADPAQCRSEIEAATELFANMHVWLPGPPGQILREPAVFRSTAGARLQRVSGDDFSAWGNSVQAVTTSSTYEEAEFLKVLGLFDLKGNPSLVQDEHYVIRSNTVYQLRVFQYVSAAPGTLPIAPHDIAVATFSDHFVQLRPTQRAVGLYDTLIFFLKSRRLPPKERSAIEIPHNPAPTGSGSYAPRALYLPIVTAGRSPVFYTFVVLILLASLVGLFAPELYNANDTVVRNLSTVILILIISGWRTTLEALFPKLPWETAK